MSTSWSSICVCTIFTGLFFSNGRVWRRQRRFAMTMLRTFGPNCSEQSIYEESRHLLEAMEKKTGLVEEKQQQQRTEKLIKLGELSLKTSLPIRWALWPCSPSAQRCSQHHLSDCVWKTIWLQWPRLSEHAAKSDWNGIFRRLCMGSGKKYK